MTEDQKAKYEEAAKEYATNKDNLKVVMTHNAYTAFLAGTEHAHPIGFNLGKEEGKKEGWNEAIDAAATAIDNCSPEMLTSDQDDILYRVLSALKKLKR